MKTVRLHRTFKKQLAKQPPKIRDKFWQQLELWKEQPFHPLLNHHVLSGQFDGLHSINVTGDIRAIYDDIDGEVVLYMMIGSHAQLYKK